MSHNCFPLYTYHHKTSYKDSPQVKDASYGFQGQKVKVTINRLLKLVNVALLLFFYTYHIMKLQTKIPLEWRVWPMYAGVKKVWGQGQRSDYWKWILAHNCFPFISGIIILYTQIPYESRICLNDIVVKTWKVWIGCCGDICPVRTAPF